MFVPTFTIDAAALGSRLNIREPSEAERIHAEATDLLNEALVDAWRTVPESVADECLLRVGNALKNAVRTQAAGGQMVKVEDGATVAAPRDPLASVESILRKYVVGAG